MLKTNTKAARANLCAHVLDHITAEEAENLRADFDSLNDYGHGENLGDFLVNFACALPIYYTEQREALATALEETPEEANRYPDNKVHALYKTLTARAFCEAFGYSLGYRYNKHHKLVETLRKA